MRHRNLVEVHRRQADRLGPRPALRHKRHGLYADISWQDYYHDTRACAAALLDAGVRPGERVGVWSDNRVEWLVADMGLLAVGAVNVPPHAPLTARQVQFQLADAEVSWLFVAGREQADKIRQVRGELPALRGVVAFDRSARADDCLAWDGFLQRGRQTLRRHADELNRIEANLGPDALATVMYTSGTTGNPKGVMLTHGNLLSNAEATDAACPRQSEAVLLNWLPLSHIYARTVDHYLSLVAGVTLALADSAETVVQNLQEIQPTHLSAVPRLYEKVLAAVAPLPLPARHQRLRAIFGARMEHLSSGGAPLPPAIAHAYHDAGILVLQGYGLTESSPVISFNRPAHYKLETVGQAIPGVEIAVAPDGEVLTRGPHVMQGYWKNPRATAEAIHDGWLLTGDLGSIDAEGFLSITGRKKELMVLSNGKKVVPSYLEGLLLADGYIDQVVVYGEGRNFLTALVVPRWDEVRKTLGATGDAEALAGAPAVRALLEQHITAALADVSPGEQIKKFIVRAQPFTVAAEEMTVSLKLRRNVVFDHHRAELEALYRE